VNSTGSTKRNLLLRLRISSTGSCLQHRKPRASNLCRWRSGGELEVDGGVAVAVDGDLFLDDAGFAVVGFEGVIAGRETGDDEISVGVSEREERMVDDVDVGEFPGMNIALETQKTFGLGEVEFQSGRLRKRGKVGFGIALL